jgi:hypothetical protein
MCTLASHAEITADPDRFRRETLFLGIQHDAEAPLVLANCLECHSTLAILLVDSGTADSETAVAA